MKDYIFKKILVIIVPIIFLGMIIYNEDLWSVMLVVWFIVLIIMIVLFRTIKEEGSQSISSGSGK